MALEAWAAVLRGAGALAICWRGFAAASLSSCETLCVRVDEHEYEYVIYVHCGEQAWQVLTSSCHCSCSCKARSASVSKPPSMIFAGREFFFPAEGDRTPQVTILHPPFFTRVRMAADVPRRGSGLKYGQGGGIGGADELRNIANMQMHNDDRSIRARRRGSFSVFLMLLLGLQAVCGLQVSPLALGGRLVQSGRGGYPAVLTARSFPTRVLCDGARRRRLAAIPASGAPVARGRAHRRRVAHELAAASSEAAESQPDEEKDAEEDTQDFFCTPPRWLRNPVAQGVSLLSFYAFHVFVLCRQTVDVPLALLRPMMPSVPEVVTLSWEVVFGTAVVVGYLSWAGAAGRTLISQFLSGSSRPCIHARTRTYACHTSACVRTHTRTHDHPHRHHACKAHKRHTTYSPPQSLHYLP